MKIKALPGRVLVDEILQGQRMVGKIVLLSDDGTSSGVRERWGHVYAIGEDITEIKVGEWILIEHGRWTRGNVISADLTVWGVEWPKGVIAVSDKPEFETFAGESVIESRPLER